jgi:pimeloyl-ACP methyl ester carboxylesterase
MENNKSFKRKVALAYLLLFLAAAYYLSPPWMAKAALTIERTRAGLDVKSVTVGKDQIFYLEGGTGPDMVLVHGFGADKDNYTRIARYLTNSYHVIIPDLTGFGESTKDMTVSYDVFSQASRLHEFIQELNLKSVHLVGHSMGGAIVGAYVKKHPEIVKSLILMAPAGVSAAPESEFFKMLNKGINPFIVESPSDFDKLMDLTFYRKPFIPRAVRLAYTKTLTANQDLMEKTVMDLKSIPFSLEDQVRKYPGPVLVIWGIHDRILDAKGGAILEKTRPGLVLKIMSDCGHMPMMEFPKKTAGYYLSFIEGASSTKTP